MALTKLALAIEYEGTRYHGFQLQSNAPTIQGEMEMALWRLTEERTRVIAASRTDAGVHAKGQIVSFRTESALPPQTFVRALNYYLPKDIAVKTACAVGEEFNVRRDAISREYHYYIMNRPSRSPFKQGFAYLVPKELDIEAMNQACQRLLGEHDFASFATAMGNEIVSTVRTIHKARLVKKNSLAIFEMVANSFLPHQVRNTIGALLNVGLGRMGVGEFGQRTEAKTPGSAGPTAPPYGLFLMKINYPISFEEQ